MAVRQQLRMQQPYFCPEEIAILVPIRDERINMLGDCDEQRHWNGIDGRRLTL